MCEPYTLEWIQRTEPELLRESICDLLGRILELKADRDRLDAFFRDGFGLCHPEGFPRNREQMDIAIQICREGQTLEE